jgi:hypothetical protein
LSPDDQLAWEERHRPRAAAAAIGGAILTFASNLISGLTLQDAPGVSVLQPLQRALEPGPIEQQPSLRLPLYEYLHDKSLPLLLGAIVAALGFLCIAYALTYLASATRARRPEFPKIATYTGLVGAVLFAVSSVFSRVAQDIAISDFLDGPRTVQAADELLSNGLLVFAQILSLPAVLALGLGFVFIGLNAMRAGLLTRFMGALGMMIGVFLVLPLLPFIATLIQVFWFGALGLMFLGRWPGGMPPAWITGKAEPWPSARAMREARTPPPAGAVEPEKPVPTGRDHPSSKKRKRKRRS